MTKKQKVPASIYQVDPRYNYIADEEQFKEEIVKKLKVLKNGESITILLNGHEKTITKELDNFKITD